jgi:hypothetical protein
MFSLAGYVTAKSGPTPKPAQYNATAQITTPRSSPDSYYGFSSSVGSSVLMSVGGVDLDQRTDQTQESLMFGISGSPAQKRADLDMAWPAS